jgi:CheY-like chemotaxis protein
MMILRTYAGPNRRSQQIALLQQVQPRLTWVSEKLSLWDDSARQTVMAFRLTAARGRSAISIDGHFLSLNNKRSDVMTGPCCMIVEDQALIGMSLEAFLADAGFSVAGPFPSCADALRWLEHNTPQVAVLDVRLRDGTSLPIAQELKERNTPFAIYSGLPFTRGIPAEFQGAPWLEKPVPREQLTLTLARLGRTDA